MNYNFFRGKANKIYLVLIIFLIITNVTSFGILIYRNNLDAAERFGSQYPLINVARNFIDQKHFITNLQPLRDDLNKLVVENGPSAISIYFEFLNTGANISINPDAKIWPASLVKVPLAMGVMKKIENGDWMEENELVLMKDDRDLAWGDLYKKPIGSRFTIGFLLKELLTNSDNTAFRILYRNLSTDELQDIIRAVGLDELFDQEGKISAKEYSRIFRSLYTSSYLKRENSQKILKWLAESPYQEYLGQGIPEKITFSHKIGDNKNVDVILDSGIVYIPNRPYLITVTIDFSQGDMNRDKALELIKIISEKSYQYINDYVQS
jgi:beta-lactamase class A